MPTSLMMTSNTSTPFFGPSLARLAGGDGVVQSHGGLLKRNGTRLGIREHMKGAKLGLSGVMEFLLPCVGAM